MAINFEFKFNLYNDTENDLKNLKSKMIKDAKAHDTEIEVNEVFTIPGSKKNIACLSKNTFYLDLLYLLIAFIFTAFGYSSLVNFFIFYEQTQVNIPIIKSIASSNIYENSYKEKAILDDHINISFNKKEFFNENGQIYEPLITFN